MFAFEKDEGRFYQVREHYAGGSLQALVEGGASADRRQVHLLLRDLLQLLSYLHERVPPVLHRDIKPSNILFAGSQLERPCLVDFDASAAHRAEGSGTTIVVSPGYSAPEQLAGAEEPASDLYSLGMTMLYLINGRHPGELPREQGALDVDGVLASLEPATRIVIKRLIAVDVSARCKSAGEALRLLAGKPSDRPKNSNPGRAKLDRAHADNRDQDCWGQSLPDRRRRSTGPAGRLLFPDHARRPLSPTGRGHQ